MSKRQFLQRALGVLFFVNGVAGGCSDTSTARPWPTTIPCTVVVEDGEVIESSPDTCSVPACAACPAGSCADVVMAGGEVVDLICYGAPADEHHHLGVGDQGINVNAAGATITITFDNVADDPWPGDLNINAAGTVEIIGNGKDETTVQGNLNAHDGDLSLRGVTITGDVSINNNDGHSSLAHCRILGNLNVHVTGCSIIGCEVWGEVNINPGGATLVMLGVGQQLNLHGSGYHCTDVYRFEDGNANSQVDQGERVENLTCPGS